MKRIITILATVITLSTQAQQYIVRINRVLPDTVCEGDTIRTNFTFTTMPGFSTQTTFKLKGIVQTFTVFQGPYTTLQALPTEMYQGKLNYIIKFVCPKFNYNDPVFVEADADMKYTQYKNCAPIINTGIEERFQNKSEACYYDLRGNRVWKHSNEILIEQNGMYRRRVFIQD